jgi:hypothetical protein
MIKALETSKFDFTRGPFQFSTQPGISYHQWVDIPYVNYQITEVGQPVSKTVLLQGPGQPVSTAKLVKPPK